MRVALAALLALSASCLGECSGVGGIANDVTFGGAWGDARPGVDDAEEDAGAAVVGIDWPTGGAYGNLILLYEAGKETTFADNDAVETPTNFGTLSAVVVTQGTLANQLTIQIPCDVGPSIPCFFDDGGDRWVDSVARAALKLFHDGTGVTVYHLMEPSSATGTNTTMFATHTGNAVGFRSMFSSSTTDRFTFFGANGTSSVYNAPSSGTGLQDQTWGAVLSHSTARNPDVIVEWRGSALSTEVNYTTTLSSADPAQPFSIGNIASGAGSPLTGSIFAIAIYDAVHGATEREAVWDEVEAITGVLPQ